MPSTLLTGAATPPTPTVGTGPHDAIAAKLYPEPKAPARDVAPTAEIAALRASEPARGLYSDAKQMGDAPRAMALAVDPSATASELEVVSASWASVATDLGFSRDDLTTLARFAAENQAKPPTSDELRQHALTSVQELRQQYGDAAFDEALAGAKALAQRDPRLCEFLDKSGLASNPWVVSRMAELARTARNRATLKKR